MFVLPITTTMPGILNFQDSLGRTPMPGSTAEIYQGLLFRVVDVNDHTAVIRDHMRTYIVTVLNTVEMARMDPTWREKYGNYHLIPQYSTPAGFVKAHPVRYIFPHPVLGDPQAIQEAKGRRIEKTQKERFGQAMAELRALPDFGADYFEALNRFYKS